MLVNKPDSGPNDEPRLAFYYKRLKERKVGNCMEMASRVHDHLADPSHGTFMHADLKHPYFTVELHKPDRPYFAFTVHEFGQLQPTRMPQGLDTCLSLISRFEEA